MLLETEFSNLIPNFCLTYFLDKKVSGKSKDEQMAEKKQELEKRLQDVTGQLGSTKKTNKKGNYNNFNYLWTLKIWNVNFTKITYIWMDF